MIPTGNPLRIIFFSSLCLLLTGCGGQTSDQPELGTVSGTVTLDGEPLTGAMLVFSPETGRSSMAITDEAGQYDLLYVGDSKGAKLGTHKISITTAQPDSSEEAGGEAAASFKENIPAKYNTDSTLMEKVQAGDNQIDFELKSN